MRPVYLTVLSIISVLPVFSQQKAKESIVREMMEADIRRAGIVSLESSSNKRTYRIWTTYQQLIELSEQSDSQYEGYIFNYIDRTSGRGERKRTELVTQKAPIPENRIKDIMNFLLSENIETLPDDIEIEGYPRGLDGTTYVFEIQTLDFHRVYSFWEPMNDAYVDGEIPEIANVRSILRRLDLEFAPWKYFEKFRDKLPPGNYTYGGIDMVKLRQLKTK